MKLCFAVSFFLKNAIFLRLISGLLCLKKLNFAKNQIKFEIIFNNLIKLLYLTIKNYYNYSRRKKLRQNFYKKDETLWD